MVPGAKEIRRTSSHTPLLGYEVESVTVLCLFFARVFRAPTSQLNDQLTRKARPLRVVNILTKQEDQLLVACEDTIADIQAGRGASYNECVFEMYTLEKRRMNGWRMDGNTQHRRRGWLLTNCPHRVPRSCRRYVLALWMRESYCCRPVACLVLRGNRRTRPRRGHTLERAHKRA